MTDSAFPDWPAEREPPEGASAALTMWVIYRRPLDYPQGCVLRAQWPMRDGTVKADTIAWFSDYADDAQSIEVLRDILPPGVTCLGRDPSDDPCIVETWI